MKVGKNGRECVDKTLSEENQKMQLTLKIIEFIKKNFSDYSFGRMVSFKKEYDPSHDIDINKYSEFIEHNKKCVDKLSVKEMEHINYLIDMIKKKKIMQCDEETFIEWETYSLYFNENGKLVLMNPR